MSQSALAVAQRYFDAWNRHDADGIVATFVDGGTYTDPATAGPLSGAVIGAYAARLWASFPDLSFEVGSVVEGADGMVTAEWVMTGTNTAPWNGLPPTGASVTLPGVDVIRVVGNGIQTVRGYFDSGAVPRALGLDVIVQPKAIGPFQFGVSTRITSGSTAMPAAFSITWLEARTDEERQVIREASRKVASELLPMPGFIGWVGMTVGHRMMTVTAWESTDAMRPLMQGGEHRSAVGRFFGPELSRGGATGVWTPARLNPRWQRCTACAKMVDIGKAAGACTCGATLPAPMPYW